MTSSTFLDKLQKVQREMDHTDEICVIKKELIEKFKAAGFEIRPTTTLHDYCQFLVVLNYDVEESHLGLSMNISINLVSKREQAANQKIDPRYILVRDKFFPEFVCRVALPLGPNAQKDVYFDQIIGKINSIPIIIESQSSRASLAR